MEKPHKNLDVWQLSMDLAIETYKASEGFPKEEKYSLSDQVRRAAVSIPSNIAEGAVIVVGQWFKVQCPMFAAQGC